MDSAELRELVKHIARDCVAVRARVVSRAVTSAYDRHLRPFGLKVSQMNILVACAVFGPVRPPRVCSVLHLEPSTLSRNVERLRKRGLLEMIPTKDSRTHELRVTADGYRLIEDAYPAWIAAQEQVVSIVGEKGAESLCAIGNALMGIKQGSAERD